MVASPTRRAYGRERLRLDLSPLVLMMSPKPPTARTSRETQMLRQTVGLASIVFVLSMLGAADAVGSAQRTFVASYGVSANTGFNCSIAKPCRAFNEAITVTNLGGEVIVLDSAGYGPVTI